MLPKIARITDDMIVIDDKTYVISDYHFNHFNIISYTGRPFVNWTDMNDYMIKSTNEIMTDDKKLLILGDFAFGNFEKIEKIFKAIRGEKYLMWGNHDYRVKKHIRRLFGEDHLLKNNLAVNVCGMEVVFSHRPIEISEGINIHGHIHEKKSPTNRHLNISVERTNYLPMNLFELVEDWKQCYQKEYLFLI